MKKVIRRKRFAVLHEELVPQYLTLEEARKAAQENAEEQDDTYFVVEIQEETSLSPAKASLKPFIGV